MRTAAGCFLLSLLWLTMAQNSVTPYMPQAFFFDWNTPGQPVPIPVTEQCQSIHITWSRGSATGPNPSAPYYLQVYTSVFLTPFLIPVGDALSYDWAVPFSPGTLYQICMFDKFGNTGGCQAIYTVIPSTSSSPTCQNITFPPLLGVSAVVDNGPLSQYGWVDQCTDISLTPTNGTAPFILTVAPALHPPYNITVNEVRAINWTVSLSWASPFFISLVDATGASWTNGPLHAGGGGTTQCLAGSITKGAAQGIDPIIPVSAGIGGLVVGVLVGILSAYLFLRRRFAHRVEGRFLDVPSRSGSFFENSHSQYKPLPTISTTGGMELSTPARFKHRLSASQGYLVEPFVMPDEEGRTVDPSTSSTAYSPPARVTAMNESLSPAARIQSHVYVLHHDSNIPPVTIYHQEGTDIVELPPRYPPYSAPYNDAITETTRSAATTDSRSEGNAGNVPLNLHQPRQPAKVGKPVRPSKSKLKDAIP